MVQAMDGIDFSAHVKILCSFEEILDGWMLFIASKDVFGFLAFVRLVHIVNGDDGKVAIVPKVSKCQSRTRLDLEGVNTLLRDVERDGYAKESAICEPCVFDNANGER